MAAKQAAEGWSAEAVRARTPRKALEKLPPYLRRVCGPRGAPPLSRDRHHFGVMPEEDSPPVVGFNEELITESRKVSALRALDWRAGSGAAVWALVITDELARHETARGALESGRGTDEDFKRFYGSGLVIAMAIGQVLAFEERVRELTGGADLAEALKTFYLGAPRASAIRI